MLNHIQELSSENKAIVWGPMRVANLLSKVLAANITFTCIYYLILPLISIGTGIYGGTDYEKEPPWKMQ